MSDSFTGGCACGAIRYSSPSPAGYMGNCHGRHCQQATGSGYFPAVVVRLSDFKIEQGEPSWYERPAERGHPMRRGFCKDCGSPLFLINGSASDAIVFYAGSLDDPSRYQPSADFFVKSAQPWAVMHADLPKIDGMPW